ncbi:MAG: HEAT repeat domain-containing protein [Gemmatales bacterium]|nr:HEAT repeat domain-containing protein [Gemmatales bacterium]MDW8388348.1 HEAT repeat domain-containing protein [Gemmatales bacterium]
MTSFLTLVLAAVLLGPEPPRRFEPAPANPGLPPDVAQLREQPYNRQEVAIQSQAALMLVQSLSPEAADIVREGLRRWDRPDVFVALASAIRMTRDRRFTESLLKAIHAEQPALRLAAAEALARSDSVLVLHRLLGIAEDPQAGVAARQAATVALGKSGQKNAVPALLSLLSSDTPAMRQAAASALEELTGLDYGTNAAAWQEWWSLHKDLSETEWLISRNALFVDRSRRLQNDLQRAESEILRLHQQLYARTPRADRVNHFRQLAQNEYASVRAQAVAWIVETLGDASASEAKPLSDLLLAFTEDGVEAVQRQAVLALDKIDDPRAFDRLLNLLQSGSVEVRAAAARSLGRYRCPQSMQRGELNTRAIAALEKALSDPSLTVVAEAVESLGSLGVPEAAPIVTGLLRHPADAVRQAAARALEQVADSASLPALYGALEDPLPSVRFHVVGALARLGQSEGMDSPRKQEVIRRLEQVLVRDGDPGVRSRAATVLGDVGSSAQLPLLWQRVTATEDSRVQVKAWGAFVDILSRSGSWALVNQWDQTLAAQQAHSRRAELLSEIRNRWSKAEATRQHVDAVTAALVQAHLVQKKWNQASGLIIELARKAPNDAELQRRLRWLVVAATQALDEGKSQEASRLIREVEDLLPRVGAELGGEFDLVRQRAARMNSQP